RYRRARDEFARIGRELLEQVQDNPAQRDAVQDLLADEQRLAQLLEDSPPAGAVDPLFGALDDRLGQFVEHEQDLLHERRARTDAQTAQAWPLIGGVALLALVLIVLFSLGAARSVTRPVGRLHEAAGVLMAGHYRSVPPEGPTEIADLIVLFNHMALTL